MTTLYGQLIGPTVTDYLIYALRLAERVITLPALRSYFLLHEISVTFEIPSLYRMSAASITFLLRVLGI